MDSDEWSNFHSIRQIITRLSSFDDIIPNIHLA